MTITHDALGHGSYPIAVDIWWLSLETLDLPLLLTSVVITGDLFKFLH